MKTTVFLLLFVACLSAWGVEWRFFRVGCLEGDAPANLSIASDESGEIFLQFDTVDQFTYVLEAAARLDSSAAWGLFASATGDGGQVKLPSAQRWSRTFGGALGDQANDVCQTSDGGYMVTGGTSSFGAGGTDVYLIKLNESGAVLWTKTLGGSDEDTAISIQPTSDGGYVLAGMTGSYGAGASDAYLVKVDAAGNQIWKNTFGGSNQDLANSAEQTSDGGYILTGRTETFGAGGSDVYLIKTDENGAEMWSKTFGGSDFDCAYSVQQTAGGGYVVGGFSRSFDPSGYSDCLLIKTDGNGTEVWTKVLGAPGGNEEAHCVQQTSDGGYILAGLTTSFGESVDMYLIKTDGDGNRLWHTTFGGTARDEASCVQETSDGGYILAGRTESFGAGDYDVYLVKTRSDGTPVWSKTFGGTGRDQGYSVRQAFDGGYIVTAYTFSFGAQVSDAYVIKTDRDGNAPLPR